MYVNICFQNFTDFYDWASCVGGWQTLPSGKMICYVGQSLLLPDRTNYCSYLGGYLLELQTLEDYQAFVYYMWKLMAYSGKGNLTQIATGGATSPGNILQWQDSKELVDYSQYGMIRPAGKTTQALQQGQILFLRPVNYSTSFTPYFSLLAQLSSDNVSEFVCMKPGKKKS